MKTLLILRHAKSSWDDPGQDDHERPLNARGRRAAPRMGLLLKEEGLVPDRIMSSTAVRAKHTAIAVGEACEFGGDVELNPALYLAGPRQYIEAAAAGGDGDTVLLVGHNPGMEELLLKLTGRHETFPTAGLACVELPIDSWKKLNGKTHGTLRAFWRPKELEQGT